MNLFKKKKIPGDKNSANQFDAGCQNFLFNSARQFIDVSLADIDSLITTKLQELTVITGSERSYIYLFTNYETEVNLMFQYVKPGLKSKTEHHTQINAEDFSLFLLPLKDKKPLILNSKGDLPVHAYRIHSILENEKTKSLINYPLINRDSVIGFIGLDSVSVEMDWTEKQITTLRIISELISAVLQKKNNSAQGVSIEQKLRTLYEKIEDTVFITSPEGRFMEINPAGLKLFGYNEEEILNISIPNDIYINPQDWLKFKRIIDTKGFIKDFESTLKTKDGKKIQVIETSTTIRDFKGEIIAYEGIIRDVTDSKRLEQQLFQSQKMESIGMLAGGIAHDFNNILSAILGLSDVLLLKMDKDGPYYKEVSGIHSSGKKAENLIKQLLGFSRKQIVAPEVVNINSIVTDLYKMIPQLITEGVTVQILTDNSLDEVLAEPTQIQQIIINLVVNADQAINQAGNKKEIRTIIVQTRNIYLDENFVLNNPGSNSGKHIELSVKDNGVGMADEIKNHIFEPFFTSKSETGGTGLGLANVYGIVRQNKGFIKVESACGQGSEFKIYWPVRENPAGLKQALKPGLFSVKYKIKKTIFVVDDDPEVRDLAGDALRKKGYKVFIAESGKKALGLIHKKNLAEQIDLLFSDVVLPEMNGKELAQKLLKLNSDVKILLSSANGNCPPSEKNVHSDNISFILKPYTAQQLEKAIHLIFNNKN